MVTKVFMPRLSLTMKEGTVIQWYKREGEAVTKGEPLVEVLSEKVTYDVEAPASGILRKILVPDGMDAPVNAVLALITAPGEEISDDELLAETAPPAMEKPLTPAPTKPEKLEKRVLASPAAKRLAREYGIDLSQVVGTGPGGRIVEVDVQRFIEQTAGLLPKVKEIIPLVGVKKTSAERVAQSFRTAPHCTLMMEVDMARAVKFKEDSGFSYTAILIKAVAKALKEYPMLNSKLEENAIKIFEDINVGVAVATEKGLLVPVVRNTEEKSLTEISSTLQELLEKAREGKLDREDMTGGTFTITNLGMYDVFCFTPIINPPEAAILGVGKIFDKPVISEGQVKTEPAMILSLSFDHRIVDGAPAAQFLRKIKHYLESPELL
jgi:pyruvate dehydrogenase E2 component (dihydrolipoamide acetyltransferase)